jgi:small subunit ribosomal protein S17
MATKKTQQTAATKVVVTTGAPRELTGVVVSTKMKDTIVVRIDRYEKHPKYDKYVMQSKRFKAHDVGNTKALGDTVTIVECPPISKDKHFKVV